MYYIYLKMDIGVTCIGRCSGGVLWPFVMLIGGGCLCLVVGQVLTGNARTRRAIDILLSRCISAACPS